MQTSVSAYADATAAIAARLVEFLRTFQDVQENFDFRAVAATQARLREAGEALLPPIEDALAQQTPPAASAAYHGQLQAAVACFVRAVARLLGGNGADIGAAFVESRRLFCEGLTRTYALREHYAALQAYWLMADAAKSVAELDARAPDAEVPLGVIHHEAGDGHAAYALYVPECYSATRRWPLVVALHGGYGHGYEYLWTWLRAARSHGYVVLAPKSLGPTWSILDPPQDIESIRTMLNAVSARYAIDADRIYLSGLSDGGSFAYIAGLSCPSIFAAIAPIAGVVHPMTDRLLRGKQGISVPLYVIHGARDPIFDVRGVRATSELLAKIGYDITYVELPEWGHAYTDTLNEQRVLPWFAGRTRAH